jgi:acyl-CoA thioesterase-1
MLPASHAGDSGAEKSRRILILGDSLAAGYGVDPSASWPALLQERISAGKLPFEIINAGVSGDTSAGGLRRLTWLLRQPVDILLLELGGNDGLRGLPTEQTQANLLAIIRKTQERWPGAKVVVAGMEMPSSMGPEYARDFERIFPEVAGQSGATLIPFLLSGVAGDPELNLPDLIHPNPAGHQRIADHVWSFLQPLLEVHPHPEEVTP